MPEQNTVRLVNNTLVNWVLELSIDHVEDNLHSLNVNLTQPSDQAFHINANLYDVDFAALKKFGESIVRLADSYKEEVVAQKQTAGVAQK